MRKSESKKTALVIKDHEVIHLLASLMESGILRLLSERLMTETQLSKESGLIVRDEYETGQHELPF